MFNQGRLLLWLVLAISQVQVSAWAASVEAEHVAGEYVVQLKDQVGIMSQGQVNAMVKSFGGQMKTMVSKKRNTMVVQKSMLERTDAVLEQLNAHPMVKRAEPNYIYRASLQPDDARLGDLWGLVNPTKSSGGVDIDAPLAWDITTGDRKVVVAVIDTGVNYNLDDLKNNMWVNQAELNGQPGVDDDGNGYVDDIHGYDFANNDGDPMDDNDHGSHCSGTIGAEGNNGIGVVGVNWQVSIMALKFLSGSGGGTLENAIRAIDYATEKGVDIMSNSWGGGGQSTLLEEAIQRAEQKGILFVAAAGNESNNNDSLPSFPASYEVDNVISVAAIDRQGNLASFSNYGETSVDIAAPGVKIVSTGKSQIKSLSGTSMATPHVSGVAALLLANNPNMDYQQLKYALLQTSVPRANLSGRIAYGVLNAFNALTGHIPPPDENDPSNWDTAVSAVSSEHPYQHNTEQVYVITHPGAAKLAVHFARFETEKNYDKVEILDGNDQSVGFMTGTHDGMFSPVVMGDTIKLKLTSDNSVSKHGFDVDTIHFVMGDGVVDGGWRNELDSVSTDHPYSNRLDEEVVFRKEGAKQVKVKFSRFETERGYDFVSFYDGDNNLLAKWDGDHDGEFSPTANGDTLVVRIQSDSSVRRYGFDVESLHYLF